MQLGLETYAAYVYNLRVAWITIGAALLLCCCACCARCAGRCARRRRRGRGAESQRRGPMVPSKQGPLQSVRACRGLSLFNRRARAASSPRYFHLRVTENVL